jgi:hypothetical protein
MIDLTVLRTELLTDPNAYGYAEYVADGSDQATADLLNAVRDGVTVPRPGKPIGAAISVRRADITPSELLEAIDSRDIAASPAASLLAWFQSVTQLAQIRLLNADGSNTRVIANLQRLITLDTNLSRTRLTAIASRAGSRAEQLFGTGTRVEWSDVATALRG